MICAYLLHLSYNMWGDCPAAERGPHFQSQPFLRWDDSLWTDLRPRLAEAGFNMVVLDLGDGIQYQSHPEIAVQQAWSREQLREQLQAMRAVGLEPIPKLNFSASHDAWLGDYARRVSTPEYYEVCRDLIAEVTELFESPRFFHLGMDEEDLGNQRDYEHVVIRQHELWWHDLNLLVDQVEKLGARAWVWSDRIWEHKDEFCSRMSRNIVQSNWYYGPNLEAFEGMSEHAEKWSRRAVEAYRDLDAAGFEQVPTVSNWYNDKNAAATLEFMRAHLDSDRVLGCMMAPWFPTLETFRDKHEAAIAQMRDALEYST
jgi:hypothetical protein